MVYLSHSTKTIYQTCQRRFRFLVIDKYIEEEHYSSARTIGLIVHSVLEHFIKKQQYSTPLSQSDLIIYAKKQYDHHKALGSPLTDKEKETIEQTIEQTITQQIMRYYDHYHKKILKHPTTHQRIERRITIPCTRDCTIRGIVDRVDVSGDMITIIDYKTGQNTSEERRKQYKSQLITYAIAIREAFPSPTKKIEGSIISLASQTEETFAISEEMMQEQMQERKDIVNDIGQNTMQYARLGDDEQAFPPTLGNHCGYCGFHARCPARAAAHTQEQEQYGQS